MRTLVATFHIECDRLTFGDIEQAYASNQGFMHDEVDMKAGEAWTQKKYREMNERYQRNAFKQLRKLAKQENPFFLNYWPLFPLSFVQEQNSKYNTLNGGTIADILVEVYEWVGEIVKEVDKLGIAENTIIVVMGDNGPFMQYAGPTGQSDRIYRGGKADHLEGGVRVNAWVKWKGVIEAGSFREERPIDSIKYGPWAGGQFVGMIKRHLAFKRKYPDRPATHGKPYTGIENLRPESKRAVEIFMLGLPQMK